MYAFSTYWLRRLSKQNLFFDSINPVLRRYIQSICSGSKCSGFGGFENLLHARINN